MAQTVERRIGSAEVTGSIPVSSFFCCEKRIKKDRIRAGMADPLLLWKKGGRQGNNKIFKFMKKSY